MSKEDVSASFVSAMIQRGYFDDVTGTERLEAVVSTYKQIVELLRKPPTDPKTLDEINNAVRRRS